MSQVDIRLEGLPAPPWLAACRSFVEAVLQELGVGNWEVSILFCGDAFIRELNSRYRGLAEPTDVLSFAQEPQPSAGRRRRTAGDIVISLDSLARNAAREGESPETELKRLLLHGILHLQGLDHPEEGDSDMLRVQERLLEGFRQKRIEL